MFREASGRNGGGVRQQFRDPAEIPLAMESVGIWAGLADELGRGFEYSRKGSLRLLRSQEELDFARSRVEREKAMGLEVELLSPDKVRERVPSLAPDLNLLGGTLCPSDGTANPLLMGQALEPALREAGVSLHLREPVGKAVGGKRQGRGRQDRKSPIPGGRFRDSRRPLVARHLPDPWDWITRSPYARPNF